jgi:hypothetical protein
LAPGGESPPEITYVLCGLCLIVSYLLEGRGYRYFLRRDLARYVKPNTQVSNASNVLPTDNYAYCVYRRHRL